MNVDVDALNVGDLIALASATALEAQHGGVLDEAAVEQLGVDELEVLARRVAVEAHARAKSSLLEFIPASSKRYARPRHLQPILDLVERSKRERVLAVVSAPPRHGKSEALIHAIPYLLLDDPKRQIAYIGYAQRFAEKKSRKARDIARRVGVPLAEDSRAKADWRTGVEDGGLWATSIGGALTGEGFHTMLVDDPVKDRKTAESPVYREHAYEWFNDTAFTRLEPKGSCIVVQTRWHVDDLAGRLIKDGWENVCLPALDDAGRALWPERFSAEALLAIKEQLGEYGWASLYQGRPFPRGGAVFKDAWYSEGALPGRFRIAIGADFAYSANKRADYSTIVVLAECDGFIYVLDVYREQVESPQHAAALREVQSIYGVPVHAFIAGTEKGVVSFMAQAGVNVTAMHAGEDKFARAQPVAAAWNAEKVLIQCVRRRLKDGAEVWMPPRWAEPFITEVCGFTGVRDPNDDQVDALAAAFEALRWGDSGVGATVVSVD